MTHKAITSPGRSLIAATLATSLALTPIAATPARADTTSQTGAIAAFTLFGLLAAGLIANSVSNQRDHGDRSPLRPPRGGNHPHHPRVDPRKQLPASCAFTLRHGPDRGTYYGNRCLARNFDYSAYLPDRCEKRIHRRGQPDRNAYDASCLARFGYTEGRPPRSAHH